MNGIKREDFATTTQIFSQRVKQLRLAKGIPQQRVADALGVTKPAYQGYEYGTKTPSFAILPRLADFFDVSTDYLLGRSDDPHLPRMDDETRSLFLALKALKETHGAAK